MLLNIKNPSQMSLKFGTGSKKMFRALPMKSGQPMRHI